MGLISKLRGKIEPLSRFLEFQIYRRWPSKPYVNLGGGPNFMFRSWMNFDSAKGRFNPKPHAFTETSVLPLKEGSRGLVYSSHFLEHVPPKAAEQVIKEAFRVLESGKHFVLKIPDFELTLSSWKEGDKSYFDLWGLEAVIPTWESKSVPDTLAYRAAMIFCGYWNKAYGDHFSKQVTNKGDAYHGPPALPEHEIESILSQSSPFRVAASLREAVLQECTQPTFNHQCAWSQGELERLLTGVGFRVLSFDKSEIIRKYNFIPGIKEMEDISLYVETRKP